MSSKHRVRAHRSGRTADKQAGERPVACGSDEYGVIKKKWTGLLPVALLFPNAYRVGMSNLGFQILYRLANSNPAIVCERFFLPERGERLLSLESSRPLSDFPLLLCSLSFEEDILSLVRMLLAAGLPPHATDRKKQITGGDPFVIVGGAFCLINPEPLAPLADLIFLGEAEPALPTVLEKCVDQLHRQERSSLSFDLAASSQGVYAPALYHPVYSADGMLLGNTPPDKLPERIQPVRLRQPEVAGHSTLLSPWAEFSNIYLTELGRGCSRGCRFCAAGFVYRPPRLWWKSAVENALQQRPAVTDRIGLLGLEMSGNDVTDAIAGELMANKCRLSFSSLRADRLSSDLTTLLRQSQPKTLAIAPDGASERLRRVINKGLSTDDLLKGADAIGSIGVGSLKIYIMLGLPTEETEDINELVELVKKIKAILLSHGRSRGKMPSLVLSVAGFVPKPWTPFQYHPFAGVSILQQRIRFLRESLTHTANVRVMSDPPEKALLQAVIARGDRRLGQALLRIAAQKGPWQRLLRAEQIDPAFYAERSRAAEEYVPWDIIDHGIHKKYLWREYMKALAATPSPACDTTTCRRCGVCA